MMPAFPGGYGAARVAATAGPAFRGPRARLRAALVWPPTLAVLAASAACSLQSSDDPSDRDTAADTEGAVPDPAPGTAAAATPATRPWRLEGRRPTLADRAALRLVADWPDDCEAAFGATGRDDDAGVEVHELDAGAVLLVILCAAGAYQPSHVFVRVDTGTSPPESRLLDFDVYGSADGRTLVRERATELWGETTFLDRSKQLTILNVSRQTRDCGVWARHDLSGPAPRLLEAWARWPCGEPAGEPVTPGTGRPPAGWTRLDIEGFEPRRM